MNPLQDVHCCLFVVLNRLRQRNKIMFVDIGDVVVSGHFYNLKKKKMVLNYKHFVQGSHSEARSLKKYIHL